MIRPILRTGVILAAASLWPAISHPEPDAQWWPQVSVKARTIAIDPTPGGEWRLMPDQEPRGALSPDGAKVAFLGSPNDKGFALFVADVTDVTDDTPHLTKNIRQVTPVMRSIVQTRWTHNGKQIVFATFDESDAGVYILDPAAPDPKPHRLSAEGEHARDPRPGPDGRVAFRTVTKMAKPYPGDLVVIDADGANRRSLRENTGLSDIAWSPDGAHIAFSVAGSLIIVDAADGSTRELPYPAVDDRLYAHYAPALAWRPDGGLIAMRIDFAGGTAAGPNADAPPPPPPFWNGKLFLIPVGEGELDPGAVTWIAAPDHILAISWATAAEARARGEVMDRKE